MDVFKKKKVVYKVLPFLEVYRALTDLALMANGWSEFFQKFLRWKLKSCATGCSAVRWMAACLRKVSNNPAVFPPKPAQTFLCTKRFLEFFSTRSLVPLLSSNRYVCFFYITKIYITEIHLFLTTYM